MFDVTSFLDSTVTEANSTVRIPVPVGEYTAIIDKVDARSWTSKNDPSKSGIALDIVWSVDDENVKQLLGMEKVTVKQGIMLDLTDAGSLDLGKGRNIGLGKLREAVDLNRPGQAFAPSMLTGHMAKVSVQHRIDERNPDNIFAEVKAVAKL